MRQSASAVGLTCAGFALLDSLVQTPVNSRETTMKTMILSTVVALFIVSPVYAVPLEWRISGTTLSNSGFIDKNDVLIDISGRVFTLRMSLDTDFVGTDERTEFSFSARQNGQVDFGARIEIGTLGSLPVNGFSFVEYSLTPIPGDVASINLPSQEPQLPGQKQFLFFDPDIHSDDFQSMQRLGPIGPIMSPHVSGTLTFLGPNLLVHGQVTSFSAEVPEGGSTALLLTSGLVALGFLWRRYKGSVS
jgi:hypothetical protein